VVSSFVALVCTACAPGDGGSTASEGAAATASGAAPVLEGEPPPSGREEAPEVPAPATEPEVEERRRVANLPWTGDLDGMLERRVIRVLVVPSKTRYFVEEGRQRGVTYEALKEFEDVLNRKQENGHVKVLVVFIPTSNDQLIPGLLEGRGDIAASSLTITAGRQEQVDFSAPSMTDVSEIAVTGPSSPPLATLDDLAGKEVFVRRSSSFWEHLEDLNRRFASEGKKPVILEAAPEELGNEDLLEMVNAGLVDITIADDFLAELWAQVLPDLKLHPDVAISSGGQIAWMIRKDSPLLKTELDQFVKTHGRGTAFGNTVLKRYLGSTQFVKNAASDEEAEKFRNLVELFRKYSGEYDMDYLLMIAQGYQESRLDHSARSHVGAIGVMQIMPATGAELKVGDITELEANVHGGVKYMRWMIEHYYKDEPMTDLNKALFAFASYNAGPGRMRQLRKEATARGLDPNVWFNNVELVAADKIGSETVTYVSNIFKYAVAYHLLVEQAEKRREARESVEGGGSGSQR
jgi:membrane-bound lytic murein transglycosylase MltF